MVSRGEKLVNVGKSGDIVAQSWKLIVTKSDEKFMKSDENWEKVGSKSDEKCAKSG